MLCRFAHPCPRQSKIRLNVEYTSLYPWGQSFISPNGPSTGASPWKECPSKRGEHLVGMWHAGLELGFEPVERGRRRGGFHLNYVQRQFVGPRDGSELDSRGDGGAVLRVGDRVGFEGGLGEQSIGDGQHVERASVHDHVLELDTENLEEIEWCWHGRPRSTGFTDGAETVSDLGIQDGGGKNA